MEELDEGTILLDRSYYEELIAEAQELRELKEAFNALVAVMKFKERFSEWYAKDAGNMKEAGSKVDANSAHDVYEYMEGGMNEKSQ